jgi:hypothetical protein
MKRARAPAGPVALPAPVASVLVLGDGVLGVVTAVELGLT